jgi:predicted PurR-regulated permease PerM
VELLLAGVVMGFVCSPLTNFLEDRGVNRTIGALVALLVLIAVLVGVFLLLMPPFVEQLAEVLRKVPTYVIKVRTSVDGFWRPLRQRGHHGRAAEREPVRELDIGHRHQGVLRNGRRGSRRA